MSPCSITCRVRDRRGRDATLAEACRDRHAFAVAVTGLRSLGRGVAFALASPTWPGSAPDLARTWAPWLTPQDRQGYRPHITIQNKVAPDEAAHAAARRCGPASRPFDDHRRRSVALALSRRPLGTRPGASPSVAIIGDPAGNAAIDHDGLPGHETARRRGQEHGGARDLVRLADPPQRRVARPAPQVLRVLPQGAGKIGPHQAGRDAVGADAASAPTRPRCCAPAACPPPSRCRRRRASVLPRSPAIDETTITDPPPRSAIPGSTMLHSQWLLRTLLPMIRSQASSGMPIDGPKYGLTAALQTSVSIRPHSASVRSTSACSSSLRPILQATTSASPPRSRMPAATASHASAFRLLTTTRAPCSAMRSAMARPIPLLDPVMTATWPVRSNKRRHVRPPSLFATQHRTRARSLAKPPGIPPVGRHEHDLQAILIAIFQGATELFPISSLGHAVMVPALLNWHLDQRSPEFLPFLVLLHTGTAVAAARLFLAGLARAAARRARRRRRRAVGGGAAAAVADHRRHHPGGDPRLRVQPLLPHPVRQPADRRRCSWP